MISPGRAWWLAKRDYHRGWRASWADYVTCDRLAFHWRPPPSRVGVDDVAVCMLIGENQVRLAIWALASWFHYSKRNWAVVIHDDGTLSEESGALLRRIWPEMTIHWRAQVEAAMNRLLDRFPGCSAYRRSHVLALKLFDVNALVPTRAYIMLDSDLLFFSEPREVLKWVDTRDDSCWFNEDVREANCLPGSLVRNKYGFTLWPRVNSGLCLLQGDILDLNRLEKWISENPELQLPENLWRTEQTLLAMSASWAGKGGLLPSAYEVSLRKDAFPGCVMRHYLGAVRDRFFGEGIPRLAPVLLKKCI